MGFVVVGVVLLVLKLAALGTVAHWPWWLVLAPFALAVVWWQLSDQLGWTTRAAQRRDEAQQKRRRAARVEAMSQRQQGARFGDSRFDANSRSGPGSRSGPDQR